MVSSDVIDAVSTNVVFFLRGVDFIELNVIVDAFLAECHGFINLDSFGELAIRLQVSCFVGRVLEDDISPRVLERSVDIFIIVSFKKIMGTHIPDSLAGRQG